MSSPEIETKPIYANLNHCHTFFKERELSQLSRHSGVVAGVPLTDQERRCIRKRVVEIRGQYFLEEAKLQLDQGNFQKAKDLLAEANVHSRRFLLRWVQFSLGLAPNLSGKLINFARRLRQNVRSRWNAKRILRNPKIVT